MRDHVIQILLIILRPFVSWTHWDQTVVCNLGWTIFVARFRNFHKVFRHVLMHLTEISFRYIKLHFWVFFFGFGTTCFCKTRVNSLVGFDIELSAFTGVDVEDVQVCVLLGFWNTITLSVNELIEVETFVEFISCNQLLVTISKAVRSEKLNNQNALLTFLRFFENFLLDAFKLLQSWFMHVRHKHITVLSLIVLR